MISGSSREYGAGRAGGVHLLQQNDFSKTQATKRSDPNSPAFPNQIQEKLSISPDPRYLKVKPMQTPEVQGDRK